MQIDVIKNGNCLDLLKELPNECIDLTVTSPPYDNLRTYNGYTFDFENIASELFRVTKAGGVLVWIVNDAVVEGSETGTSFRQVLYFKEIGFNLHDTMIWKKDTCSFPDKSRYFQIFEYMFVLSKGIPKTINKICDRKNLWSGSTIHGTSRNPDGSMYRKSNDKKSLVMEYGERFNVWEIPSSKSVSTWHPATFPQELAADHITTWSNKGDLVLDPFIGSGTTALAAIETGRHFIGFEISKEYFEKTKERVSQEKAQMNIFDFI